jgi:hypothetical protein
MGWMPTGETKCTVNMAPRLKHASTQIAAISDFAWMMCSSETTT